MVGDTGSQGHGYRDRFPAEDRGKHWEGMGERGGGGKNMGKYCKIFKS